MWLDEIVDIFQAKPAPQPRRARSRDADATTTKQRTRARAANKVARASRRRNRGTR